MNTTEIITLNYVRSDLGGMWVRKNGKGALNIFKIILLIHCHQLSKSGKNYIVKSSLIALTSITHNDMLQVYAILSKYYIFSKTTS